MAGRRLRVQAWRVVSGVAVLLVMASVLVVLALPAGLPLGPAFGAGAVGALLLAGAYVLASRPARVPRPPHPGRVDGSASLAGLLLAGVSLLLVGLVGLGLATTLTPELLSSSRRTSPAVGLVLVVLSLATAWWLLGIVLGTVRARLDLDPDGVRYRGGRTDRRVLWPEVESVALADGAQRVIIRVRDGDPLRFSTLLFDVVASGLVAAIEDARRRHRGAQRRGTGPGSR